MPPAVEHESYNYWTMERVGSVGWGWGTKETREQPVAGEVAGVLVWEGDPLCCSCCLFL